MMSLLFDQEKVWEAHDKEVFDAGFKKGYEEGYKEGYKEGREEVREEKRNIICNQMRACGISEERIKEILSIKLEEAV